MNSQDNKCVIVINEQLPLGLIANCSAIMGISLGQFISDEVGEPVMDNTGTSHMGIIKHPVPVLKATDGTIHNIRHRIMSEDFSDIVVVDFSETAQGCKTYDEYINRIQEVAENELTYYGLGICGNKKKVNRLTGSLPLLR